MDTRRFYFYKIKLILILLINIFLYLGCTTYSQGPLSKIEEIENTKEIVSKTYSTSIVKKPERGSPILELKINEYQDYNVRVIPYYTKMEKNWFLSFLGLISLTAGLVTKDDSIKNSLLLLGGLFIIYDLIKPYDSTYNFIQGASYWEKRKGLYPLRNNELNVYVIMDTNSIYKRLTTNKDGLLVINIPIFLEDKIFYRGDDFIEVKIIKDGLELIPNLKFKIDEIAAKYVKVKYTKVNLFEKANVDSKVIKTVSLGDVFLFIEKDKDWIKLEYENNKYGWIPALGVQEFYSLIKIK